MKIYLNPGNCVIERVKMRRTNSRVIRLPVMAESGRGAAAGLKEEEADELNARSYDYARRTAVPTLDDYIIAPFSSAFKDSAFAEAVNEAGLNDNGILKRGCSFSMTLNGRKFEARAYPSSATKYENVLSLTGNFLEAGVSESKKGVIISDDEAYISIDYLLDSMSRFAEENSAGFNRRDLRITDPATGNSFPLDKNISEINVYFDMKRFSQINTENADAYFKGLSLKSRVKSFSDAFEKGLMRKYGMPDFELDESISFDYELSDGSGVRYLFFPKALTNYSEVYKGLVGRGTKNIAASNGDLDILKVLAFEQPYQLMRKGLGINVSTESYGKKGKIIISRISKDGTEERAYSVLENEGIVYASANDIKDTIERLTWKHTQSPTFLKIDFFAAPPKYLNLQQKL